MKEGGGRASPERRKGLAVITPLSILGFRVAAVVVGLRRRKKMAGRGRG
jgi:hypothetical protein